MFLILPGRGLLPFNPFEVGPADVPEAARLLVRDVVRDVARVPDDHVLVVDRLAVALLQELLVSL